MSDHLTSTTTDTADRHEHEGHEHEGHEHKGHEHEAHQDADHDADVSLATEPAGAEVPPTEPVSPLVNGPDVASDDSMDPDGLHRDNGSSDRVGGGADRAHEAEDAAVDGDGTDDAAAAGDVDDADAADGADGADGAEAADGADGADGAEGVPRRGNRVRLLEKEGEVAADFLERLLDIADLDGDIEVDIDGDRAAVAIVDSEDGRVPRRLVGSDGKVLEALQELTRLAVQAETGERSRLMLDVAGHRAQRRVQLVEVARTVIAEVKTTGQRTALEDMSAFERKIVHDEVAAAGLDSESEGVEPHRHIVVFPA